MTRTAPFLALALLAAACAAPSPGHEEDDEVLAGRCGVERWAVKTGTDPLAAQVNLTPQDTTIAALRVLPTPNVTSSSGRLAGTAEMQMWRLTNVTLVQYKLENDSDLHLVLRDAAGLTMIAELTDPGCVNGGVWGPSIAAAHAAFLAKLTPSPSFQTANVPVTVTGVAFFDLQHGQTGVAPNAIELHAVQSICFVGSSTSGCGAATPDFSVSASPAAVTGPASVSIATSASNDFAGNVAFSLTGLPGGASAAFSPATVATGAPSTLALTAGTAAAGTYPLTLVATSGTVTHTTAISWTVPAAGAGGIVNGDFEQGTLAGWTTSGTASTVSTSHAGKFAARVGSTSPSTNSTLVQRVAIPAGTPRLSFFYKVVCPDSLTYDWATVTIAGSTSLTALAKTCSNDGAWHAASVDVSALAGQTATLTFTNHDDDYVGDATYTLIDDVEISGGSPDVPDFSLALGTASVSSTASAAASDAVTVTARNGFSAAVALAIGGVPQGASASFSPASVTGAGTATLTLTPGTAPVGTYALTVTGTGGGLARTATLSWTLASAGSGALQTAFIILLENHNWSSISGSASAPYINGTLLPQASYALHYQNPPGLHPSLPNYLWLEAGTNFGVTADGLPSQYHQSSTQHLVSQLDAAGISWKSYQEGISGTTCPLTATGLYAPKHNPMVFFDDVTNARNAASSNCIAHIRPLSELATDLQQNAAPRFVFITPDLCNDMHNSSGCATTDSIRNGDDWLAQNVPVILASSAYRNGGALFITWDESEGGDVPIGMIVLSPKAKGHGYTNALPYTHSSTLRSLQEIFGTRPFLGDAANATDLSDLFTSFP